MNARVLRHILLIASFPVLGACASSSHELLAKAHPAISPDAVTVYWQAPEMYERVAVVTASSGASLKSEDGKLSLAIDRLRREAAQIGANGILLFGLEEEESPTMMLDIDSIDDARPEVVSLGISTGLERTVSGIAIYVPPDEP